MKIRKVILSFLLLIICFICACDKNGITKVSDVNEFDNLINKEGVLLYDIRIKEECEAAHIPYFMCMGSEKKDEKHLEELIQNIEILYGKNKIIIFIGEEEDILFVFKELEKDGYKKLYYFDGGYETYANLKGKDFIPATGCDC